MFINQKQLFELKYNPDSRFYDFPMCMIYLEKAESFLSSVDSDSDKSRYEGFSLLCLLFCDFFVRRIGEFVWRIYFPDDSCVLIRKIGNDFSMSPVVGVSADDSPNIPN